jgi:hypothetical protein
MAFIKGIKSQKRERGREGNRESMMFKHEWSSFNNERYCINLHTTHGLRLVRDVAQRGRWCLFLRVIRENGDEVEEEFRTNDEEQKMKNIKTSFRWLVAGQEKVRYGERSLNSKKPQSVSLTGVTASWGKVAKLSHGTTTCESIIDSIRLVCTVLVSAREREQRERNTAMHASSMMKMREKKMIHNDMNHATFDDDTFLASSQEVNMP